MEAACAPGEDLMIPHLELQLITVFRALHRGDGEITLAPSCQRLVAFLAVRGPLPRSYVAFRLWPDHPEDQALACLRTTLWRLPRWGDDVFVQADTSTLRLADVVEVDINRCYAEAAAWEDGTAPPPGLDVDRFVGDILTGWYDDWALMERERFRQVRLHLLERLSVWATRCGRFTEAIAAALWAVEGGPLRESGYRCLARAHLAEGNVDEAVHHVAAYLTELGRSGLPRRLSPAMVELLPDNALRLLAPLADR
jgi:DNA-binding SARP family transcriptional activator